MLAFSKRPATNQGTIRKKCLLAKRDYLNGIFLRKILRLAMLVRSACNPYPLPFILSFVAFTDTYDVFLFFLLSNN